MAKNNSFIVARCAEFEHDGTGDSGRCVKALDGITVTIERGEYVSLLGRNGSGKTTFARLLNGLLLPSAGVIYINGINTKESGCLWEVRRLTGMVFQNPDNQIVGTTVEEDVAFGPENMGLEPETILKRVRESLRAVGMETHAEAAPHHLSGGQKQRASLAGIIAMRPECIILDEATVMLDPAGRKEVLDLIRRLNAEENITILHITHNMEEAGLADRLIVMDSGSVVLDGKPRDIFSRGTLLRELGLDVPPVTELFELLRMEGFCLPAGVLNVDEAVEALKEIDAGRGNVVHKI